MTDFLMDRQRLCYAPEDTWDWIEPGVAVRLVQQAWRAAVARRRLPIDAGFVAEGVQLHEWQDRASFAEDLAEFAQLLILRHAAQVGIVVCVDFDPAERLAKFGLEELAP